MKINDQQRRLCCDIDRWSAEWMREIYGKLHFFWKKNKPIELDFHNRQFGTVAKISKKKLHWQTSKKKQHLSIKCWTSKHQPNSGHFWDPKWPICSPARWIVERRPQRLSSLKLKGKYPWTMGFFVWDEYLLISLKHWVWIGRNCNGAGQDTISKLDLWSAFSQQSPCPVSASGFSFKCLARIVCPRQIHPLRHQ